MRHSIYTGMMLAGLLVLGFSTPGFSTEGQSGDNARSVQMQERIHAVDETWHFEAGADATPSQKAEVIMEKKSDAAPSMPLTSPEDKKVVVIDHDYFLHP